VSRSTNELDDLTGRVSAYVKSKTLAEQAAWDFVGGSNGRLELAWSIPCSFSDRSSVRLLDVDPDNQADARRRMPGARA